MIRLAILGYGYWGPNLFRNFHNDKGCKVTYVCDKNFPQIENLPQLYPGLKVTAKYDEVLLSKDVESVVVCTPAQTHFEFSRQALVSGKHVLVEKPLAMSVKECDELIKIAQKNSLTLMVGHTFLFNAAVRKVKEYIKSGELGDILYIYAQRLNLGQIRKEIDSMWNFAPHDISIINYWLGVQPIGVRATGYAYLQKGVADVVFMTLDFPKGVGANILISWLDPTKVRRMTVIGSKKMVVYDDVSADAKVQVYDKGFDKYFTNKDVASDSFADYQFRTRSGDVVIPKINFKEPLQAECRHFLDCIEKKARPLADGNNGLRVVEILEAGTKSILTGGKLVKLAKHKG